MVQCVCVNDTVCTLYRIVSMIYAVCVSQYQASGVWSSVTAVHCTAERKQGALNIWFGLRSKLKWRRPISCCVKTTCVEERRRDGMTPAAQWNPGMNIPDISPPGLFFPLEITPATITADLK